MSAMRSISIQAFLLCGILLAAFAGAAEQTYPFIWTAADVTFEEFAPDQWIPNIPESVLPLDDPGAPWLPARYVHILLPKDQRATDIRVHAGTILLRDNIRIAPQQVPQPLSRPAPTALTPPSDLFAANQPYPAQHAVLLDHQTLRGQTYVVIRLNPLTYEPTSRRLLLATNLLLTLQLEPSTDALRTDAASHDPNASLFASLLNGLVINPSAPTHKTDAFETDEIPAVACDYLIITSTALSNSFQRLADFRASQNSLTTRLLTLEAIEATYSGTKPAGGSDTQTKIRNAIIDHVTRFGTAYILLGGDNTVVPDRDTAVSCGSYSESAMPTDLYYSGLDGTWDANANGTYGETADGVDMAYDVIVGRVPVRTTAQADAYINKLIAFESGDGARAITRKTLLLGDTLWNSYTGASRPTDTCSDGLSQFNAHSPVADDEIWCRRLYRTRISLWTNQQMSAFFDTLTSWDSSTAGDYLQNASNVRTRFNEGWNHVFFATHGNTTIWGLESGYFTSSDAAALTNLQTLVYTMACLTGAFDTADPSLSEAFLRNPNGGALAYMGCSRYGWGSPGSYSGGTSTSYADKYYDQVFTQLRNHIGIAFAEHKLAMASSSTYNGANRWVQFGMNLQGDPLVPIRRTSIIPGDDTFWFRASALTNSVLLRWPNPIQCGMGSDRVRIDCSTFDYPTSPSPSPIYEGTDQHFLDTDLPKNQERYYTIWVTHDNVTWIIPLPW